MRVHFEFDGTDVPRPGQAGEAREGSMETLSAGAAQPGAATAPGQVPAFAGSAEPAAGPYDAGAAPADLVERLGARPGATATAAGDGRRTIDGGAAPRG
ncbi:hypothetical protein [Nonomuraea zeae]|uniref:Uncharacterized protein n=1 Tax=Nonomuraea zeae TaxID=1642303 RepID=A0A5S4G3I9_9ACTN|nr:hypothetical protein [Nonomuraea zeae]TMR27575.1 hypothetical protein ETD85_38590 [Nonomuraea zeae]